jgi:hypothetical protein
MSTDINIECGREAALSRDVQHIKNRVTVEVIAIKACEKSNMKHHN